MEEKRPARYQGILQVTHACDKRLGELSGRTDRAADICVLDLQRRALVHTPLGVTGRGGEQRLLCLCKLRLEGPKVGQERAGSRCAKARGFGELGGGVRCRRPLLE